MYRVAAFISRYPNGCAVNFRENLDGLGGNVKEKTNFQTKLCF